MNSFFRLIALILVLILSQFSNDLRAQDKNEDKYYINSNRKWFAEVPLWLPGFRGQLAYGDIDFSSSGSEEEFDRINSKSRLEFYFVGRIATQYVKLWFQADIFSGEVGSAFTYNPLTGNNEKEIIDIQVQATMPRLVGGYSVWQKSNSTSFKMEIIPYLGVRYVSFHLQTDIFNKKDVIDIRPDWFEPLIGLYVPIIYKRFKVEIQSDYGSTGTKSSLVLSNRYRYRISKLLDVQLGWNLIHLYHKGTVGNEQLESTIKLFGPTAGVGFKF